MKNPTTTYFALTTGPIFKTMVLAKRTREIWAASYIFSWLMKQIVNELNKYPGSFEIILPVVTDENEKQEKISAGLYPDRLIVVSTGNTEKNWKKFIEVIENAKHELISEIKSQIDIPENMEYVDNFHTYFLQIELDKNEDPITRIFPLLDTLDQQATFNSKFNGNILSKIFQKKWIEGGLRKTQFYSDAFDKGEKHRFPQVLEIAAHDLKDKTLANIELKIKGEQVDKEKIFDWIFDFCLKNEGEKKIIDKKEVEIGDSTAIFLLRKLFNPKGEDKEQLFRHYHKYMAVVMADGDDVGKLMQALFESGSIAAIREFSGILMQFGEEANHEIKNYGGVPVYLGGDDMLFFAPVKCGTENIFGLAQKLSDLFANLLRENETVLSAIADWNESMRYKPKRKPIGLPTLSFGVALSYHKYPLREAIEAARGLLFDTAKNERGKNTLAFRYLKHSGHNIAASVSKSGKTWEAFLEFLAIELDGKDKELKNEFMSSLQYKLEPLRPMLQRILTGRKTKSGLTELKEIIKSYFPDESEQEFLLKNFSVNFFNEGGKHDYSRGFILIVLELLLVIYRDLEMNLGNNIATADKAIDLVYAILRLKHFYMQPDNEEEEQ